MTEFNFHYCETLRTGTPSQTNMGSQAQHHLAHALFQLLCWVCLCFIYLCVGVIIAEVSAHYVVQTGLKFLAS